MVILQCQGNAAFNLPHCIQHSLSVEENNQKCVYVVGYKREAGKEEREGKEDRTEGGR